MIKLSTPVMAAPLPVQLSLGDRIMVLGSCFADSMGSRLSAAGFDVCVNPFGTLYNPVSICNSVARLASGRPFTEADCVEMGAGAGLVCSWSHHTSFARPTVEEFLRDANASLAKASEFWKSANKVLITLGTAMVWKLVGDENAGERARAGEVVSNCLKRPAAEFSHEMLGVQQVGALLQMLVEGNPDKEFIFTVSPIRHIADGLEMNSLSKAVLRVAVNNVVRQFKGFVEYFPAFEIVIDDLRDYRFYGADMVHPSDVAIEYIWQTFQATYFDDRSTQAIARCERVSKRLKHRPMSNNPDVVARFNADTQAVIANLKKEYPYIKEKG